jgi:hypothetical protein
MSHWSVDKAKIQEMAGAGGNFTVVSFNKNSSPNGPKK